MVAISMKEETQIGHLLVARHHISQYGYGFVVAMHHITSTARPLELHYTDPTDRARFLIGYPRR